MTGNRTAVKQMLLRLFQITNLMHNSFIFQQYVCYTALLNMFRAARCSSSGGTIVSLQPLVLSFSVSSRKYAGGQRTAVRSPPAYLHLLTEGDDTRGCGDTIVPPEDERCTARNMLRSAV